MKKKSFFTLMEIMIVVFLIGLIGSVIGYNMKGSLEKGKAFKTERAIEQVEDILNLQIAQGYSEQDVVGSPREFLQLAGHSKPDLLLKDGWGKAIIVSWDEVKGEVVCHSPKWEEYKTKQLGGAPSDEDSGRRNLQ